MNEQRFFWTFDRTIWDQIRLPGFEWWETSLLAAVVLALGLYLAVVVFLDRRFLLRMRFNRQAALLRPRLEAAELGEEEMEALHRLAGSSSEHRLLRFLGDPVAFETRVHEAMAAGEGAQLAFIPDLREALKYTSDNFLVPMVSTRQMRTGDGIRLSSKGQGLARHHYGKVQAVEQWGFRVQLGEPGMEPEAGGAQKLELFYVRGRDLEHRFPALLAGPSRDPRQIAFRHTLVGEGVRPRQSRLPLLIDVAFRERPVLHQRAADALDPEMAPLPFEKGILHDLNDGGFSIVLRREVQVHRYLEFILPSKRGKSTLRLMGRVTACRPIPGDFWMAHANLRGMERDKRHLLHQIVMHEQSRRFKTLARIQPRRGKGQQSGKGAPGSAPVYSSK